MKKILLAATALAALAATPAQADENYFGYVYGSETLPKGQTEGYLWVTNRSGKGEGHYDAQDYKLELEHGLTDRLQASGYLLFASHHIRGPGSDRVDRDFGFQGISTEFKYRVLSPYKDGIGLALYVEPAWKRIGKVSGGRKREFELETKAIIQKNFLEDRLIWATNLTFEFEWEREAELDPITLETEHEWERELKMEVSTGLSYQVAPGWFAGVEGRYQGIYPDWTDGLHRSTYALFAGPSIHYGAKKWWFTATWLPQIHGRPSGPGSNLDLDEHEKNEFRLKIGYNF